MNTQTEHESHSEVQNRSFAIRVLSLSFELSCAILLLIMVIMQHIHHVQLKCVKTLVDNFTTPSAVVMLKSALKY